MTRRLRFLACLLAVAGVARADGGTTAIHDIESAAVADNEMGITALRRLLVYVPEGCAHGRRTYPVLYWIPGWETPASREYVGALDSAIADGALPPVIVVHVDVREGLVLQDSTVFGRWEEFMTDEVVPFVDAEYRTIAQASGRALMGHSTGGYGAMMLPLLHPGIWGAIGLNDASVWGGCAVEMFWTVDFPLKVELADYEDQASTVRARIQMGIAVAPDAHQPLGFSVPQPPAADLNAEWRDHCMLDPETVAARSAQVSRLAAFVVGIPSHEKYTNRAHNLRLVSALGRAGVKTTVVPMIGGHGEDRPRRFVALAKRVVASMHTGFPDPGVTRPDYWSRLKDGGGP